jgi:hypothetical protein
MPWWTGGVAMTYGAHMNAVPFDTLRLARRLEAAGLAAPVAAGASEALAEAMSGAELATKSDLEATESALRADLSALRTDLKASEAALRADLKASESAVRSDMELLRRDMTIRLGGMMILGVGILLTAMRFMPLHP